jgi:hypothetical protein
MGGWELLKLISYEREKAGLACEILNKISKHTKFKQFGREPPL